MASKSIWEVLGFTKGEPKKKVEVLQDYRVHFAITFKDKPMLGKIEGQAVVTSTSCKEAEKHLEAEILQELQITHPYVTQACQTVKK